MITASLTLQAGVSVDFVEQGDFFRLMQAAGAVSMQFFRDGRIIVDAPSVAAGYAEKFGDYYDKIRLTSATTQQVQFVSRYGSQVAYDIAPTGDVSLGRGAVAQGRATVSNANQVLIAANAARKYLLVQNNDPAAVLRVNLAGVAATATTGLRVPAGGMMELTGYQSSSAINCMMEVVSAVAGNVEFVEG